MLWFTGAFSCLEIQFILTRDVGYFIIQVYLPSLLVVILSWVSFNTPAHHTRQHLLPELTHPLSLSWVSFWINVEASPARVSIGLLTTIDHRK